MTVHETHEPKEHKSLANILSALYPLINKYLRADYSGKVGYLNVEIYSALRRAEGNIQTAVRLAWKKAEFEGEQNAVSK